MASGMEPSHLYSISFDNIDNYISKYYHPYCKNKENLNNKDSK